MTTGFAASICSLAGDHLREIRLDIEHEQMLNEDSQVHSFVENKHWNQESWFRMFNHLASFPNLVVLELLGGLAICPEFFRGIVEHPGTPFPSLVELQLEFAPETADGRWFHQRDEEALERSRRNPEHEEFWRLRDQGEEEQENYGRTGVWALKIMLESSKMTRLEPTWLVVIDTEPCRIRPLSCRS
jgi:hypothetical protein